MKKIIQIKKQTQHQAELAIRELADKAGLYVLIIGDDNFSDGMVGKKFSKAQKSRLKQVFFDLLCDGWNEKKLEAIEFEHKYPTRE